MPLDTRQIGHLVAAMLNVNNFGLYRAQELIPAFEQARLLDPAAVHGLEVEELKRRIESAGYSRGGYIPVIAGRMYTLMTAVSDGTLDNLSALVADNDRAGFIAALSGVYGWGPKTAAAAWRLWTEQESA